MAELAKSFITISDESAYAAGVSTIIPLYVIATESNKVLDTETGEIAPGTTFANELLVMTSQRDVINTFGVPNFTKVNGTVMQSDELNEVGLLGLYDAMSSSSLGYAVRANIDLGQLKGTIVEPTQSVKNGTKWFDLSTSTFGVYRSKYAEDDRSIISANNWEEVSVETFDSENDAETIKNKIIFVRNDKGGEFKEYINGEWLLIGSDKWKQSISNIDIDIVDNKSSIIPSEDNLGKMIYDQSDEKIYKCVSYEDEEEPGVTKYKWEKISDSEDGLPTLKFRYYKDMPEYEPQGSIWINMSNYNNGSNLIVRTYNSTIKTWTNEEIKLFNSTADAEQELKELLTLGTKVGICGNENNEAVIELKVFDQQPKYISSDPINHPIENTTQLNGSYTFAVSGRSFGCNCSGKNAYAVVVDFNRIMAENGISSVTAGITDGILNYESLNGLEISITPDSAFTNVTGINYDYETCWVDFNGTISFDEPRDKPEEGTYWYDTTEKFDILISDGSEWKCLNDIHPDAKLYVSSEMPEETISLFSLWINTNAKEYPTIYRYEGANGWKLLDNTDQTTAYGVLFADARFYDNNGEELTFAIGNNGVVSGTILKNQYTGEDERLKKVLLDPDAPKATAYPKEMVMVNTRFTGNNVKKYKEVAFEVKKGDIIPGGTTARWVTASGNATDGSGLFGAKAQRKMIVDALAGAINSCEELRSINYDFFYACCPGYPEVDTALTNLNSDKKDMFYIVSDTPKTLAPTVRAITDWGSSRTPRSPYMTRQYPPMGMTSNVDGTSVAVPTSLVKMNNLLNLPMGQICAGTQNGIVTNVSSVGYITDENEYASVSLNDGLGEAVTAQSMNPIMMRRNTGLLLWGENTENNGNTSLSDEHAILTILRLKRELDVACTPFFFRKNTKSTREDFDFVIRSILSAYVTSDELYDFVLDTETPNTAETISRKELHANIAIEIVKGIEFIYIPIRVVNTGTLSGS